MMANDRVVGPGKAQVVLQPCRKRSRRNSAVLKRIPPMLKTRQEAQDMVQPCRKNAGSGRANKAPGVVKQRQKAAMCDSALLTKSSARAKQVEGFSKNLKAQGVALKRPMFSRDEKPKS